MEIKIKQEIKNNLKVIKFIAEKDEVVLGRVYLYLIYNDLHHEPFALIEDLYVGDLVRGQGFGTTLINQAIKKAKELKCYKIIGTSRYGRERVHKWYEKIGFKNYGLEFRMELKNNDLIK